ncbi:MAG: hypothetical protein MJ178_00010 [Treponemataceae bacterium]|nr:hypothetical protein [Treponemataceae bacterium]
MTDFNSIRFQAAAYLAFPILLAFRIIPPLIMPSDAVPLTSITAQSLLDAVKWLLFLTVIAIPALMAYRNAHGCEGTTNGNAERESTRLIVRHWLVSGAGALALLILNNFFWSWIPGAAAASPEAAALPPVSLTVICFIAVSALWEELLYRLYLSESLISFLGVSGNSRWLRPLCDGVSILVFAFSHRYMGWYAVGNALVAASIFTVQFRKAGPRQHPWLAIFLTSTVHFSYNLILYLSV